MSLPGDDQFLVLRSALRELRLRRIPTALSRRALLANEVSKVHVPTSAPTLSCDKGFSELLRRESHSSSSNGSTDADIVDWHFAQNTVSSVGRRSSADGRSRLSCSQFDEAGDQAHDGNNKLRLASLRCFSEEECLLISDRLHRTELRPTPIPQPPPHIAATRSLRSDFSARHATSAPPRPSMKDEEFSSHFFSDAQRHKMDAAQARDAQDIAAHIKQHHTIDKGCKLSSSDASELIKRLKDDAILIKVQDHQKLTEKYVDRIRKRGCPQPPGRRRRQHHRRRAGDASVPAPAKETSEERNQ